MATLNLLLLAVWALLYRESVLIALLGDVLLASPLLIGRAFLPRRVGDAMTLVWVVLADILLCFGLDLIRMVLGTMG